MTLLNQAYILPILLAIVVLIWLFTHHERAFLKWVNLYWFKKATWSRRAQHVLFLLGVTCLGLSLLDVRGPEEKISATVATQKSIIVIDTSSSMLVEDVRPNRFERGLFLARHFVRSAVGHQISIIVFSDSAKRIIPFTDDVDLLDARISALSGMNMQTGGSNIHLALKQAVQFHLSDSSGPVVGNILLITDGEEHAGQISDLAIPENITIASLGVGTARGGRIPLRAQDGSFRGYKRFNSKDVISELNETFFQELNSELPRHRYWVAHSYNLPTDEILDYFNKSYQDKMNETEIKYRPVWGYPLIGLALSAFFLSNVFALRNAFLSCLIFLLLGWFSKSDLYAQDEPKITERANQLLQEYAQDQLTSDGRLELAQELIKSKQYEHALKIYEQETHDQGRSAKEMRDLRLNKGTAQMLSGRMAEGLATLRDLYEESRRDDPELADFIKNNILHALAQQEQQQQQQQQQDEERQEQQESGQGGQGQPQDKKDERQEDQKGEQEEESEEQKDESKEQKNEDQSGQGQSKQETPALIQQIMDDDRELQKKQLDMGTRDQGRRQEAKDW